MMKNIKQANSFVEFESHSKIISSLSGQFENPFSVSFISGEPGSGKTTLALYLQKKYLDNFEVISYVAPVDSYESFISILASNLNCDFEQLREGRDLSQVTACCAERLREKGGKLLILCDQSQSVYLATFERILRLQQEWVESGFSIHLVFLGESLLEEVYDRLIKNDKTKSNSLLLNLELLNKEECSSFVKDLVKRRNSHIDKVPIKFLDQLYKVTKGNMKETERIAEKVDKDTKDDASFFSLLNDLEDQKGPKEQGTYRKAAIVTRKKQEARKPYVVAGLCFFIVALIGCVSFYFFKNGGKPVPVQPEQAVVEESQVKVETKPVKVASDLEKTVEAVAVEIARKEAEVEEVVKTNIAKVEEAVENVELDTLVLPNVSNLLGLENESKEIVVKEKPEPVLEEESDTQEVIVLEPAEKIEAVETEIEKKKEQIIEVVTAEPKKIQKKVIASSTVEKTSKQIYDDRLRATAGWLDKRADNYHTLQLMALTSENAVAHLQEYLGKDSYKSEAENFFILRKKIAPESLFVFYGEFDSKEEAKEARANLSEFLHAHEPYILTIDSALKKAGL